MNYALNEEKIKKQDQVTKENHQETDQKEKKCYFYYYSKDRIGNYILSLFCSSLLTLFVKAYLQILIFSYYPNKFLFLLNVCKLAS